MDHRLLFSELLRFLSIEADSDKYSSTADNICTENIGHLKTEAVATATTNNSTGDAILQAACLSAPTISSLDFAMLISDNAEHGSSRNNIPNETIPEKMNNEPQTSNRATKRSYQNQGPAPSTGIVMKYLKFYATYLKILFPANV